MKTLNNQTSLTKTQISKSSQQTQDLAQKILSQNQQELAKHCLIFALQGELGSGKTQFAKGLGKELNISRPITSPTYILIREYQYQLDSSRGRFYHLDCWRLKKTEELKGLGLENMLQPGNILAIEWLKKIQPFLKNLESRKRIKIVWVKIDHLGPNKRKISWQLKK